MIRLQALWRTSHDKQVFFAVASRPPSKASTPSSLLRFSLERVSSLLRESEIGLHPRAFMLTRLSLNSRRLE